MIVLELNELHKNIFQLKNSPNSYLRTTGVCNYTLFVLNIIINRNN